jgi:hypothetical protein
VSVATKPSAAITAPPRNATWNPSVRACGNDVVWLAKTWFVRVVASVDSTARPSAPPICCEVLISPLASPCSRPGGAPFELVVAGLGLLRDCSQPSVVVSLRLVAQSSSALAES